MKDFDYSEFIEAAKTDIHYFMACAGFTLRRMPDAICVDTLGNTDHYPLTVDTAALNEKLKAL